MIEQIDILWVVSVFVTGWAGYRLAERYELPPLAGFALGVAVNTVIVADRGVITQTLAGSRELQALSVVFSMLLLMTLFALAGVERAFRVLKVTAVVALMAVGFSFVPRPQESPRVPGPTFSFQLPSTQGYDYMPRSLLPAGVLSNLQGAAVAIEMLARVNDSTPLYHAVGEPPVSGRHRIRRGDWVIVQDTVSDRSGETWVKVLVADAEGRYQESTGSVGYVPADRLSLHVPVPAFSD